MHTKIRRLLSWLVIVAVALPHNALLYAQNPPPASYLPDEKPPLIGTPGVPMVMLNLTRDRHLFSRAYTDYADLNENGQLDGRETGYDHVFDYYGYFDSKKCYIYSPESFFVPNRISSDKYCGGAQEWSGNFLNWVAMARIDVLRKTLYGGKRYLDEENKRVILERAYLPSDIHSWAKHFKTTVEEMRKLTPFSDTELTFCNTTAHDSKSNNRYSHANTNPPLIRVARGNFSLWASGEVFQCRWLNTPTPEYGLTGVQGYNNNRNDSFGVPGASSAPPDYTIHRVGEYVARVQVCVPGTGDDLREQNCKTYANGDVRPVGLLQEYGETGKLYFGLMTGSYAKSYSGGVLRRNIGNVSDEIDSNSGRFIKNNSEGIVKTIDNLRIVNYDASLGRYQNYANNGNPVAEIYIESLRYLAGQSTPTAAFDYDATSSSSSQDSYLGLPKANWLDPLRQESGRFVVPGVNQCSRMNVVNFSTSVPTFDTDDLSHASSLNIPGGLSGYTDKVGTFEGLAAKSAPIGGVKNLYTGTCTTKQLGNLSEVYGICSEAPTQRGGYQVAGAAYWAHTNRIRSDFQIPDNVNSALKVNTISVSLAPSTPKIAIPVNGKTVLLQPSFQSINNQSSGTLADFRVIERSATGGKFYVSWEDSLGANDNDMDLFSILEYRVSGNQITISTIVAGAAGAFVMGSGYIISGTNADGNYLITGHNGFPVSKPNHSPAITNPCPNEICYRNMLGATSATFDVSSTGFTGAVLKDPLWYAAKYGGFDLNVDSTYPNSPESWAKRWLALHPEADANTIRDSAVPDNYFLATNPSQLAERLREALEIAASRQSYSSAAINSTTLTEETLAFQSSLVISTDSGLPEWTGDVKAFNYSQGNGGSFSTNQPRWSAAERLSGQNLPEQRQIITRAQKTDAEDSFAGVPMRWNNIDLKMRSTLYMGESENDNVATSQAQKRLEYLRGSEVNEGNGARQFRPRRAEGGTKLGDIVNSSPVHVGAPKSAHANRFFPGYTNFREFFFSRKRTLWVAANDGFLHAFQADASSDGGKELLAYAPSFALSKMVKQTVQSYDRQFIHDGTPMVNDVEKYQVSGDDYKRWQTVLVNSLGAGGKGIYALNITDPAKFLENNAAQLVLWEHSGEVDPDLGYILSQPSTRLNGVSKQIVRLNNGRWAAVVGNGVKSTNGKAVLYLLYVDHPVKTASLVEGTDFIKVVLANGPGNGLSTPALVDVNNDGNVDLIYAGDALGDMYRVDVTSENPNEWKSTSKRTKIYDGGSEQPITTAPVVAFDENAKGYMISFGTGILYSQAHTSLSETQSIIGIFDAIEFAQNQGRVSLTMPNNTAATKDDTLQYVVSAGSYSGSSTLPTRIVEKKNANHKACFNSQAACGEQYRRGWSIDLPTSGERVIFNPVLSFNGALLVSTTIPPSPCQAGGAGWLMQVSYRTGEQFSFPSFDTNGDRLIDSQDAIIGGIDLGVGALPSPVVTAPRGGLNRLVVTDTISGLPKIVLNRTSPDGRLVVRHSWREVFQ